MAAVRWELQRRKRCFTWEFLMQRRAVRQRYIELYKRSLGYSKKKPSKCAVGKHQGKGSKPRECWDKASGFAAKHVHESTSKPKAYSKRVVLDEVQRRVPHCDVFLALRRVTEGFGGWLAVHGYDDGVDALREDAELELSLRDASLEEVNVTSAGALNEEAGFPAGTSFVLAQPDEPSPLDAAWSVLMLVMTIVVGLLLLRAKDHHLLDVVGRR